MDKEQAREKARMVLGEALARAMYDTPVHIAQRLREGGYDRDCVDNIAARMVRELERERWQIKGPARDGVKLEGLIHSGIRLSNCQILAALNPDIAKSARSGAVENICNVLRDYRIVLIQWRKR